MSTPTSTKPAGWYPDPDNAAQLRYWSGEHWTEHRAPAPPPMRPQHPAAMHTTTPAGSSRPWYSHGWVAPTAAGVSLIFGLLFGVAAGGAADPKSTPEYEAVLGDLEAAQSEVEATQKELGAAESALADAEDALGDLPTREADLAKAQSKLERDQVALEDRERQVKADENSLIKREKAVGIVETQVANNTIPGEGLFKVGKDMKPGTYKTSGSNLCYYAVLNSTNTFDIADNNNVSGPAYVTVNEGKFFETSGCADWVLQP